MFDYKKLDQYKVALDDGFEYCEKIDGIKIRVYKTISNYYICLLTCSGGIGEVVSKDFDNFKTKVEEFYEGGK